MVVNDLINRSLISVFLHYFVAIELLFVHRPVLCRCWRALLTAKVHRCLACRHYFVSCQHRPLNIGTRAAGGLGLKCWVTFLLFFKKHLGRGIGKSPHLWLLWCFCVCGLNLANLGVLVCVENGLSVNLLCRLHLVILAVVLTPVVLTAEPLNFSFDLVLNKVRVTRTSETLVAEVLAATKNSRPWILWGSEVVNLELNLLLHCLIQPHNTVTLVD